MLNFKGSHTLLRSKFLTFRDLYVFFPVYHLGDLNRSEGAVDIDCEQIVFKEGKLS